MYRIRYSRRPVPALVAAALLAFIFFGLRGRSGAPNLAPDATVYATDSGEKYHLAGCSALSQSRNSLTRAEAEGRGLMPCQSCLAGLEAGSGASSLSAPASGQTVYVTRSGKKYHRLECSALSRSREPIPLAEARQRGYEACDTCQPPR